LADTRKTPALFQESVGSTGEEANRPTATKCFARDRFRENRYNRQNPLPMTSSALGNFSADPGNGLFACELSFECTFCVAAKASACQARSPSPSFCPPEKRSAMSICDRPLPTPRPVPRRRLFGFEIDPLSMKQAVEQLRTWINEGSERCRFVVTPNVDHAVLLQEHAGLQGAYREADLVLADGHPLVWASRLLKQRLPERVPGSDLVPMLFESTKQQGPITAYLLGAAPGVAERAASNIQKLWPGVRVVGCYSPPIGFEKKPEEIEQILWRIADCQPDVLVVGLGAPKQECWVHTHREQIAAKVALCVGATIDFLANERRRAPRWMQRTGLEWLHRMLSEPKRLVKRYAKDAWVFPRLVLRQWLAPNAG
jgi:N-acetylglucosaminyldiphosphoundecaprenol N-acetyl-beta-D-mannosaminyltransferase